MLERYDPRNWAMNTADLMNIAIGLAVPALFALGVHWLVFAAFGRMARALAQLISETEENP